MKRLLFIFFVLFVSNVFSQSTPSETQKLATLCKVWGFLKYYHPGVSNGKMDWDEKVINIIPKVKKAQTKQSFNELMNELLLSAEKLKKLKKIKNKVSYKFEADFCWMTDTTIFTSDISNKLKFVLENFTPHRNYYIKQNFLSKITKLVENDNSFKNEKKYSENELSEEVRLLGLFRFWNIMNYYNPSKSIQTKRNWDSVLVEYVPKFQSSLKPLEYHLTFLHLIKNINDSHSNFGLYNNKSIKELRKYYFPFEVSTIDGYTIISKIYNDSITNLKIGDTINALNDIPIKAFRDSLAQIICASNDSKVNVLIDILIPASKTATPIKLMINKDSTNRIVNYYNSEYEKYIKLDTFKIINDKYAYVCAAFDMSKANIAKILNNANDKLGIIIDLRYGLADNILYEFADYFNTNLNFAYSRNINYNIPSYFDNSNTGFNYKKKCSYLGKIVLLVNSNVQSTMERFCMEIQTNPNSCVIGSQTAGSLFNVNYIPLPGDASIAYTFAIAYYLDGTCVQGNGVKIDIHSEPTIKGIVDGKDEVLERAIQYLNTGK